MKTLGISGKQREHTGRTNANHLRNDGQVPCVLYRGDDNLHFYADERDFTKLINTSDIYFVKLMIGDQEYNSIMKDVQYHPVTDRVQHADFMQLFDDRPITTHLPVRLEGNPIGVRNGGVLRHNLRKIKVKGLPSALPEEIKLDIEKLKIGQAIKISDLETDEGFQFLHSPNTVVARVKTARQLIEIEEEVEEGEEGAEGEVEATAEGAEKPAEGDSKTAEGGDGNKEGREENKEDN